MKEITYLSTVHIFWEQADRFLENWNVFSLIRSWGALTSKSKCQSVKLPSQLFALFAICKILSLSNLSRLGDARPVINMPTCQVANVHFRYVLTHLQYRPVAVLVHHPRVWENEWEGRPSCEWRHIQCEICLRLESWTIRIDLTIDLPTPVSSFTGVADMKVASRLFCSPEMDLGV